MTIDELKKLKKQTNNLKEGNLLLQAKKYQKNQYDTLLTEKILELMKHDGKTFEKPEDMVPYIKIAEKELKRIKGKITSKIVKLGQKILTPEEEKNLNDKLTNPQLITLISYELSKYHKLDEEARTAVFLIALSGFLPNPSDHVSAALKGDSSSGKDNCAKSALNLLPDEEYFILTRATQSALEEEIQNAKIVFFSEINKDREGANSELTEVFKQLSEGGVSVLKRDQKTGEIIKIKTEQKSLIYATTEATSDDELETRYVIIPIRGNEEKNKVVVNSTLNNISNPESYFTLNNKNNWVKQAVEQLDRNLDVIIPYAPFLEQEIILENGEKTFLFDYRKERVKRDVKRLLSLTKTITWLYQRQRSIQKYNNQSFILSEPQDFKMAFYIFINFFDLTYSGLDHRILKVYETIKNQEGKQTSQISKLNFPINYYDWTLRSEIQKLCGIDSVNTIKKYVDILKDHQLIEVHYDASIQKAYLITTCQSTRQAPIRTHQLISIDRLLTGYLTGLATQYGDEVLEETSFRIAEFNSIYGKECDIFFKIDRSALTGVKLPEDVPKKSIKQYIQIALDKQKDGVSVESFVAGMKHIGFSANEINETIQSGLTAGDWFEPQSGVLRRLE